MDRSYCLYVFFDINCLIRFGHVHRLLNGHLCDADCGKPCKAGMSCCNTNDSCNWPGSSHMGCKILVEIISSWV